VCPECGKKVVARSGAGFAGKPVDASAFNFSTPAVGDRHEAGGRSSAMAVVVALTVGLLLLGGGILAVIHLLGPTKEQAAQEEDRPPANVAYWPVSPVTSKSAAAASKKGEPAAKTAADKPPSSEVPIRVPAPVIAEDTRRLPPQPPNAKQQPADERVLPASVPAEKEKAKDEFIPDRLEIAPRGKDYALIAPLEIVDFDKGRKYKVSRLKLLDTRRDTALRLAVTPKHCDDMGSLLRSLGEGFRYTALPNKALASLDRLRHFDVVFLTCSYEENWGPETTSALREYVKIGGTLYASDLRYGLVTATFPEFQSSDTVVAGVQQSLVADVIDADLRRQLGRAKLPLHFDMDAWQPAAFDRAKCTIYLQGSYRSSDGASHQAPLLLKFRHGAGAVVFTSFHNARQTSALERKLLEYLVLSVVNARAEAVVSALITQAGFAPEDLQSMQVSPKQAMPARTHQHKNGNLQVGLGFNNLGAKLRLVITAPDGQKLEHADTATFLVEIPKAPPGTWRYQVVAEAVPFAHFPCVLAVGKTR
jgi:hypothetical protein